MLDKKHLHIALASDENYAEFVAIVITSLFATNSGFDRITLHLLSNNISSVTINKISQHIPQTGELIVYDIDDISNRLKINVPNTIAISAYSRLFLSNILPTNINKVLYVDCDVIFNNEISELWNINIANSSVAGVLDTLPDNKSKNNIGLSCNSPYINSGVLLINLSIWRQSNIEKQFIDFLLAHNGIVHHHDQGIINAICKDKLIIHPRYNLTSSYISHPYNLLSKTNTPFYSKEDVNDAIIKPSIIHFTEGFYNRPWIKNSKHPFSSTFHKYRNLTLWKDVSLRPDKRSFVVKILSFFFLNSPYWCYSIISNALNFLYKIIK